MLKLLSSEIFKSWFRQEIPTDREDVRRRFSLHLRSANPRVLCFTGSLGMGNAWRDAHFFSPQAFLKYPVCAGRADGWNPQILENSSLGLPLFPPHPAAVSMATA